MGVFFDIRRLYSSFHAPVRHFFISTNSIPLSHDLGVLLYKIGLGITVSILKNMPEIESIYSKTVFNKSFIPGLSDVDLAVIVKDMPAREEISFLKRYYKRLFFIRIFPFISLMGFFFKNQFMEYQKLRHREIFNKGHHFDDWVLLHGSENRMTFDDNEKEVSGFFLRNCYEEILLNIYEGLLIKEKNFRRAYKFTLNITRQLFIMENGRDAKNMGEFKEFLLSKGIEKSFIDLLLNMPVKNYSLKKDVFSKIIFYNMKLVEYVKSGCQDKINLKVIKSSREMDINPKNIKDFAESLDKRFIKSIFISKIPLKNDSYHLFILTKSASSEEFSILFRSFSKNLHLIKKLTKEMRKRIRNKLVQNFNIFPIFLTEDMLNNPDFINGCYPFESLSLNTGCRLIFGEKIDVRPDDCYVKKYFNVIFMHSLLTSGFQNMALPKSLRMSEKNKELVRYAMAYKLINEKGKVCLYDIEREYSKNFGSIDIDTNLNQYFFVRGVLR